MTKSSSTRSKPVDMVVAALTFLGASYVTYRVLWWAYKIRLQAIEEYGPVIHEFDPYFNYRATEVGGRRLRSDCHCQLKPANFVHDNDLVLVTVSLHCRTVMMGCNVILNQRC